MRAILAAILLAACGGGAQNVTGGGAAGQDSDKAGGAPLTLEIERAAPGGEGTPSPLLQIMKGEISRSMEQMAGLGDQAPYFIGYEITDRKSVQIDATLGGLMSSDEKRARTLDADVRVGSHELDNTHPMRGDRYSFLGMIDHQSWIVPQENDPAMLRPALWLATDSTYKKALEAYLKVKGNEAIKADAEDASSDFSQEAPLQYFGEVASSEVDRGAWEKRLREYSAMFAGHGEILESGVALKVEDVNRYIANSEGSLVQDGRTYVRIGIRASVRTDDGMDLSRFESIDVGALDRLPGDDVVRAKVQKVIDDVLALRAAPPAEPYVGPAIMEGHAAGVFFHEIFGHRVEGHRQKDEEEGMTFAKKVGKKVMPDFIDIYDDPTIRSIDGVELNGLYAVDDEAVRARRADLIKGGVLEGFLMSRSPVRGFDASNGHGRRQEGNVIVSRQGNLVVHPTKVVSPEELKKQLLEEVARQGKPYGLRFTRVQGGYTNTSRYGIQAFKVMPVMLYKVYPDGHEELIRGANIDGTPLTSLSQILAAGNDPQVFDGYCGAESGFVPVSATSPSLLVAHVEISKSPSGKDKPPILPPPSAAREGGER